MAKIYSEKELEAMNLFKLRDIAREMNIETGGLSVDEIRKKIFNGDNKQIISVQPEYTRESLEKMKLEELKSIAQSKNVSGKKKAELIDGILATIEKVVEQANEVNSAQKKEKLQEEPATETELKSGVLDIHPDGYGFLRAENCEYGIKDAYVSAKMIKSLGLRSGDFIKGVAKKNPEGSTKPSGIISVDSVNGMPTETAKNRKNFDSLVPIFPDKRITLEVGPESDFAIRCIDLIAPIGKGQRAMIVSPPKAGKTTLLKKIANSISKNYSEIELFVLLIDERPEEVTDMQRSIKGEVVYSTFDETPEHHCKAAELLIERAKRNVELGKDVVIIMDSLTRLARAYNLTIPPTGRTLSGGMDPGALHPPKKFFGSARNIENGGSLTIIATALVDTGSRMDDVIYEEFKGTGNMEIHLDRSLSERRIFPAIDLNKSSTRREDLLLSQKEYIGACNIRKLLATGDLAESTERLIDMLVKTKTNNEFIDRVCKDVDIQEALKAKGFKSI